MCYFATMRSYFHLVLFAFFSHLTFAQTNIETTSSRGETILVNQLTRDALSQSVYGEWFNMHYQNYQVDQISLHGVEPLVGPISITIFLGTWCEDSQSQVPEFLRIADDLGIGGEQITLIGLDREHKSPGSHEQGREIGYVPTFIFHRNGMEIGRIVEFPQESLEEDLYRIVLK